MQSARQRNVEAERGERACVGANAEEGDVTEAQLTGEAEQQVEAHRRDDKNARGDQRVQQIGIAQPQRNRGKRGDGENGNARPHPTRSERAKSPVGLKIRTAMMIRKPIASRYPDETEPAPNS